jgi:hypothetical protein
MENAVGTTAAGAIYTNSRRERDWNSTSRQPQNKYVDNVFNTISEVSYTPGSTAGLAIDRTDSDVMQYIALAALGASIGGVVLIWWLPNFTFTDKYNLAGTIEDSNHSQKGECESWVAWWWRTEEMRYLAPFIRFTPFRLRKSRTSITCQRMSKPRSERQVFARI